MIDNIPHEKSFRLRKVEQDLEESSRELEKSRRWTRDKDWRLDLRLAEVILVRPLILMGRYISRLRHKICSYNDGCERREY
ncbi:hypothetical protein GOV12_00045 [Candidatus Pacearchaeota archaeon]|nr:hypothetical protein [Candidatus Pacearchaeota archaeon]